MCFFTATINTWIPLLNSDAMKNIIIQSLKYLTENCNVKITGFVIMPNHIHILWSIPKEINYNTIRKNFLSYTGHTLLISLQNSNKPKLLNRFKSTQTDRNFHIWERYSKSIKFRCKRIAWQKLDYIHANPVKAQLADCSTNYYFSSARFYEGENDDFGFLTHINNV